MKILFLAHRIPYPPNKGDKIRSFNEIRYLSRRHRIDLACLVDDPKDLRHAEGLKTWCNRVFVQPIDPIWAKCKGLCSIATGSAISVGYFSHRNVHKVVRQWMKETRYDAVMGFSSTMAEYMVQKRQLNGFGPEPWKVMDFCDVDSDKWRQYAQKSPFPLNILYWMEYRRMAVYERRVNRSVDRSILISEPEAKLFCDIHQRTRGVSVVSNGVDHRFFSPDAGIKPAINPPRTLMFAGAMDYHANVDGVRWFAQDIYPDIKAAFPDTRFFIVGSNPSPSVQQLASEPDITVTGFVDDIRSYHVGAEVFVVPLRMARGVQNKVLEAMAMGKAIVTTSTAIQGIQPKPRKSLMVANERKEFAQKVIQLLEDPDLREELGSAARGFIERHYQWDGCLEQLEKIIENHP